MCGIVAIHRPDSIDIRPADVEIGRRMIERIVHRGPDDQGSRVVGSTYLGHARLAIVDLPDGSQPMPALGGHWLVANGEIYNHQEIRGWNGYPYRTSSDSEAIAAVLDAGGITGLGKLHGMYAFVLAGPDGRLVAARDELGIKPLYWARADDTVQFASELRAFDAAIRPAVEEFPPGHAWTSADDLVRVTEAEKAARRVADHLGLEHTERVFTDEEVVAALPSVVASIESYEPSLVRSAVPNYLLAQTAARSVKVVLTGEDADELFAGYDHLRQIDDDQLAAELERSVRGLHNLNLQRCDRVTMAFGLEARVPFLDLDLVELAGQIPIGWRLPGRLGQEKALLREAFDGWLPRGLLWRVKEQFGDGSGTADAMDRLVDRLVPETDPAHAAVPGLPAPRSREELAYMRIFADHLDGVRPELLGRFATA